MLADVPAAILSVVALIALFVLFAHEPADNVKVVCTWVFAGSLFLLVVFWIIEIFVGNT